MQLQRLDVMANLRDSPNLDMARKRQQIPLSAEDVRRYQSLLERVANRRNMVEPIGTQMETKPVPPKRSSSAPHRLDIEGELGRRSPFTLEQEKIVRYFMNRVYQEQYKDQTEQPQAMMGKALANLSQSSVSAVLNGKQTLSPERGELLAKLAGFENLRAMIGDYGPSATMGETVATSDTMNIQARFPNLRKCLEYHGERSWQPWVVAAARAGIFGEVDVDPKIWEKRLHDLETFMAKYKNPK